MIKDAIFRVTKQREEVARLERIYGPIAHQCREMFQTVEAARQLLGRLEAEARHALDKAMGASFGSERIDFHQANEHSK